VLVASLKNKTWHTTPQINDDTRERIIQFRKERSGLAFKKPSSKDT